MTQIQNHTYVNTTTAEIDQIAQFYARADGTVNMDAIAQDIKTGQSNFSTEDLLTFYADRNNGLLPEFMMAPAGHMSGPSAYPWLWTENVQESLTDYQSFFTGQSQQAAYTSFSQFMSQSTNAADQTLFDDVQNFINAHPVTETDETDPTHMDLFNPNDLRSIMTLFMSMGNPGLALMLYSAYGLNPRMQDLQQAALDFIDEANDELAAKMDDIESLGSSDDPTTQAQLERLRNEMSIIQSVISTMTRFIEDSQKTTENVAEMASNLSAQSNRNISTLIGNIR